MKIRKATKKDLKEIAGIFRIESGKDPYKQKWTPKSSLKKIKEAMKNQDMYIVLIDNEIVGFLTSNIEQDDKKKVYVDELWIKAEHQGGGIGRKLMDFIEEMYKKKGVKLIQLVTNKKSGAYKFYKKLKYMEHSTNQFMEKKLK